MTLSFQSGQTYEFTFSDGTVRKLRFEGLGQSMQAVWFEPSTQATIPSKHRTALDADH